MASELDPNSIQTSAFNVLRAYLAARAAFSDEDFDHVRSAFIFKRLPAGEFLQRAGDITRYAAFVVGGCLHNYVIDPKGKEHIVQFVRRPSDFSDRAML